MTSRRNRLDLLLPASFLLYWLLAAAASLLVPRTAALLCAKEGPLEHLSHAVLFTAAAWHAVLWLRSRSKREHLFLAALCLLFFLEEIDYFQLYLGYPTPQWADGLTGESDFLSFHNTRAADFLIPAFYTFYFLFLPLWGVTRRRREILSRLGLRPLALGFASPFLVSAPLSLLFERMGLEGIDAAELFDLATAVFLLLAAILAGRAFQGASSDTSKK